MLAALDPAKTDKSARAVREATLQFFDEVQKSFDKVVYLMGNHEHYGFCIDDIAEAIRHHFPDVTLLEDDHIDLGDAIRAGRRCGPTWAAATRWSSSPYSAA